MAISEEAALELVVSLHRLLRSLGRARPDRTLQPTQLITLALLTEQGPSRIGVIADRVPCSQPTATSVVVGLEAAGLVRREPDPTDGRATRVAVTESGSRTLGFLAHSEAEALVERLGTLAPEEAQQVLDVGRTLRRLADTPPASAPQGAPSPPPLSAVPRGTSASTAPPAPPGRSTRSASPEG